MASVANMTPEALVDEWRNSRQRRDALRSQAAKLSAEADQLDSRSESAFEQLHKVLKPLLGNNHCAKVREYIFLEAPAYNIEKDCYQPALCYRVETERREGK